MLPEELESAGDGRPEYLAVLVTPGFDWKPHYRSTIERCGYVMWREAGAGALFKRVLP
jgi:hypothetical protein